MMFINKNKHIKPNIKESISDEKIVRRIVEHGEKKLMELLYQRYANKVFGKCISLVKNEEIAKDLTHDIMVKIMLKLAAFKGNSAFSLWVHSITFNHCMDFLKKKKRIQYENLESSQVEQIATDTIEQEHQLFMDMQVNQLKLLLEQLGVGEKMILLMRYQEGMSIKEISSTLKLGESAVKMRLKRSRDQLAELFKMINHEG